MIEIAAPFTRIIGQGIISRPSLAAEEAYLLDTYPATAAYDIAHQLKTGQTRLVRLRRSSDQAELDFAPVAGVLDTAAVATWLGGANASVVAAEDASGNGNHATQSTAGNQPAYVASGQNGKPEMSFDGINDSLAIGNLAPAEVSCFVVAKHSNSTVGQLLSHTSVNYQFRFDANLTSFQLVEADAGVDIQVQSTPVSTSAASLLEFIITTSTAEIFFNGVSKGTDTHSNHGWRIDQIGKRAAIDDPLNGRINRVLIYQSDQTANRAAIEAATNADWAIY